MPETLTLPEGYRFLDAGSKLVRRLEAAAGEPWTSWSVTTIDGDAEEAVCHWRTNDDRDTGAPSEYADDTWVETRGPLGDAVAKALRHAGGGCRYGIAQVVIVQVNGRYVEKVG